MKKKTNNFSVWFKISLIMLAITAIFVVVVFFVAQELVVSANKEVLPKIQATEIK